MESRVFIKWTDYSKTWMEQSPGKDQYVWKDHFLIHKNILPTMRIHTNWSCLGTPPVLKDHFFLTSRVIVPVSLQRTMAALDRLDCICDNSGYGYEWDNIYWLFILVVNCVAAFKEWMVNSVKKCKGAVYYKCRVYGVDDGLPMCDCPWYSMIAPVISNVMNISDLYCSIMWLVRDLEYVWIEPYQTRVSLGRQNLQGMHSPLDNSVMPNSFQ